MCSIPNGFQDRAISLYSSEIVDKKEMLRTVSNIGTYCSSDKVGGVYVVYKQFFFFPLFPLLLPLGAQVILETLCFTSVS
jgi:hypothetical protein